jgi:hypothetical protein
MVLVCSILTNTKDYTDITDLNITKKDQTIKQKAGYVKLPAMSRKFQGWQCNTSFFSSASVTVTRPPWLSHCKILAQELMWLVWLFENGVQRNR